MRPKQTVPKRKYKRVRAVKVRPGRETVGSWGNAASLHGCSLCLRVTCRVTGNDIPRVTLKQSLTDSSFADDHKTDISNFAPGPLPKAKAAAKARVFAVATSTTITTTRKHTVKGPGELKPTTISTSIGLNKQKDTESPATEQ
uniref:Uncharacterized protein n=1 Tax=Chromera velia CCMP2878 TaxID=1169474 RepID=A0A0G4H0C9_9ALVE|eukprot:Cvel_24177.t1-p1 / transcript=Cvel_24177.t1 / gene=Cvel_24177 / organism=Chromera_velia_CCMP2878 / gene_product=hypothetical protein / transcript_product=hypothetical protein / location=Cvel_scaffold2580:2773-5802(-) / protein_length=142 / sequence_SO=supercontig / SO=protein_coding / is_pseudo=false